MRDGTGMDRQTPWIGLGFAALAGMVIAAPAVGAPGLRVAAGYLDRNGSPICHGGTHQLDDPCSGTAVPLRSKMLDLEAFLCRSVEALGAVAEAHERVIEIWSLRETPSGCPVDCDADGLHDDCAIRQRLIPDCNVNGSPDRCDITHGVSGDCNRDGVPDECQVAPCELDDRFIMLTFDRPGLLTWRPERRFNAFNVYRGHLDRLSGNEGLGQRPENGDRQTGVEEEPATEPLSARRCDVKGVTLKDDAAPALGEAFYYRVSGNRLGAEDRSSLNDNGARGADAIACPAPSASLNVSVRTDRAIYAPGENVHIEVQLANLNPEGVVDLRFATPCEVTFRIEDRTGASVYLDLAHHGCPYRDGRLTLRPGQIASYAFEWDQKNDRGAPVSRAADYVVRGIVLHQGLPPDGITGISIRPDLSPR